MISHFNLVHRTVAILTAHVPMAHVPMAGQAAARVLMGHDLMAREVTDDVPTSQDRTVAEAMARRALVEVSRVALRVVLPRCCCDVWTN
jgi:hypothetical protein